MIYDYNDLGIRDRESYRTRDGFGGKGILNDSLIQQYGIEMFNPGQGQHFIDVIPYPCGDDDPMVTLGKMKPGTLTYICQAAIHTNVGPSGDKYVCVAKTLAERCGRCDVADTMVKNPDIDDELIKSLRPSKFPQCLYWVWDRNSEGKGVQLWLISAFFMERDLQNRAKQPRQLGAGKIVYAHPGAGEQGGRHIKFDITGQGMNRKFIGHEFHVRKQPIPEEILRQAREYPPLDAFLVWPDYNELKEVTLLGLEAPVDIGAPFQTSAGISSQANFAAPNADKVCPYGAIIGEHYGRYEECGICEERFYCEGLLGKGTLLEPSQPSQETPWEEPTSETVLASRQPAVVPMDRQTKTPIQNPAVAQRPVPLQQPVQSPQSVNVQGTSGRPGLKRIQK